MHIRKIATEDISWVESTDFEYFGSPRVVSRGVLHDSAGLPAFIAEDGSGRIGLLQYHINKDECEVINLISLKRRQGIGTRLLKAVEDMAATPEIPSHDERGVPIEDEIEFERDLRF